MPQKCKSSVRPPCTCTIVCPPSPLIFLLAYLLQLLQARQRRAASGSSSRTTPREHRGPQEQGASEGAPLSTAAAKKAASKGLAQDWAAEASEGVVASRDCRGSSAGGPLPASKEPAGQIAKLKVRLGGAKT